MFAYRNISSPQFRNTSIILIIIAAFIGINNFYGPSIDVIESINPAKTGFLGGLGLPIVTKIINEHSGNFTIKNKIKGSGTIVKIAIPKFNV